ncbi:MAG: tetratricopeptide repeat protein, partial [Akkermansiaceae bacterium]|nr:tetratricopeptide repeat protein [Armatimonadota bacterium]
MKRFRSAVLLLSALIPASFAVAAAPPAPVADPRALYEAATVAANAGDYPRAVALCRQALKVSPEAAPVWATLGRFLSKQLRHNDAIAAAQKAVALSPKFAPFRADLGNFYLQAERRVEAAVSAQKALSLDPRNDIALTTLATCRLAERRDKEAIPLLTRLQSVRGGKNRAVSQMLLATYRRVGDLAGALRSAKAFAAKTPGDAGSVLRGGQIAVENRGQVSTQQYAAKLKTLAPQSPLPDYYLGLLALSDPTKSPIDRFQNGERLFQKAVDRSPNETFLRAQLGYAQLGQVSDDDLGKGKIAAARTNLTAAVLYENHDPVSRRGLAMVAEKERFWEDAAMQYEAVVKITPGDNESRRRYA